MVHGASHNELSRTCRRAVSRSKSACSRATWSALEAAEKPHTLCGTPCGTGVLCHTGTLLTARLSLATSLAASLHAQVMCCHVPGVQI